MTVTDLQRRLEALQAGGRLPGVVAGVLADGELAWTGAAGMPAIWPSSTGSARSPRP